MRAASLVLLIAFGLVLVGFVLVFAGIAMSGSVGVCFFWPFPVIIVCGAGTGGASYIEVIVGAIVLVALSVFYSLWIRKAAGSSAKSEADSC